MTAQDHGKVQTYRRYKCRCDSCRGAMADYRRKYLQNETNREKERNRKRLYYATNQEAELERNRHYRQANRDRLNERQRQRTKSDPSKAYEILRRSREKNKDAIAVKTRAYRDLNRQALADRERRYRPAAKPALNARRKAREAHVNLNATRHRDPWTSAEDAVVNDRNTGVRETAALLSRTCSAVRNRRAALRCRK